MDEFEMRRIIYDYIKEICHLSQMQLLATSSYQKNYFQMQIDETVNGLINFFMMNSNNLYQLYEPPVRQKSHMAQQQTVIREEVPEITIEELSQNNGSEGKPAYVAVNNNVYDMSQVIQWAGGTHFGLYAGRDVSNEFMACHKGMAEILDKLPKVGVLKR